MCQEMFDMKKKISVFHVGNAEKCNGTIQYVYVVVLDNLSKISFGISERETKVVMVHACVEKWDQQCY